MVCSALAPDARDRLAAQSGTCTKAIAASLKGRTFPTLDIRLATADGDTAVATIVGQTRVIALRRQGGAWKVTDGGS
jgi:hypothetical protein